MDTLKIKSSDNHICYLFLKKAEIGVKIFSQYRNQIHNVYDLKNYTEFFFSNDS